MISHDIKIQLLLRTLIFVLDDKNSSFVVPSFIQYHFFVILYIVI